MAGNQEDHTKALSAPLRPALLDRAPVPHVVARHLQDMIRSGELELGQRLPGQRELAGQLGVSRPSLREALLTLETLGLIRTEPGRGTFVAAADVPRGPATWRYAASHDLKEVFQCRLLLERAICRLTAPCVETEILDRLRQAAEQFRRAWEARDLVGHVEADRRFHGEIARSCPNRMLQGLYASAETLLSETQRQPLPATPDDRMIASIAEHEAIVRSLAQQDPDGAEAAMCLHIVNTASCVGIELQDFAVGRGHPSRT